MSDWKPASEVPTIAGFDGRRRPLIAFEAVPVMMQRQNGAVVAGFYDGGGGFFDDGEAPTFRSVGGL